MAGFIGIGTIDVRDDGIVVEARRHRYGVNFIGGAVLGVLAFVGFIVLGMEVPKQGPSSTSSAWVAGLFGFVLGAWIVSLSARWSRPVQLVIPPRAVESIHIKFNLVRVLTASGDIQFTAEGSQVASFASELTGRRYRVLPW